MRDVRGSRTDDMAHLEQRASISASNIVFSMQKENEDRFDRGKNSSRKIASRLLFSGPFDTEQDRDKAATSANVLGEMKENARDEIPPCAGPPVPPLTPQRDEDEDDSIPRNESVSFHAFLPSVPFEFRGESAEPLPWPANAGGLFLADNNAPLTKAHGV